MAVLTRITDFIPNTLIESQEVDDEFNQLVNLLSGVSTNKDTLLKYDHATDPVLRVDQLGAGVIQRWLQNGSEKARIINDGSLWVPNLVDTNSNELLKFTATGSAVNELTLANAASGGFPALSASGSGTDIDITLTPKGAGKVGVGTPGGSPVAGIVGGPDASGSNIAGVNLNLHGGKATGNGVPGLVSVRHPLIGGSGSTLQSLSTSAYPVTASFFSATSLATAVANTVTETSLFTGASTSAGSTRTMEAGQTAAGTVFRLRIEGTIATTGTPTLQFRIKFGSTTVGDTTAATMPNNSNGSFVIDTYLYVYSQGAANNVRVETIVAISPTLTGVVTLTNLRGNNLTTVDFTASQTLDVTAQWGTASASNTIQLVGASLERIR
jgi:hypothetical protein